MLKALIHIDRILSVGSTGDDPVLGVMESVEDKLAHAFKNASTVWFNESSGYGQVDFVSIVSNGAKMYCAKVTHRGMSAALQYHSLDELIELIYENSSFASAVNGKLWLEDKLNSLLVKSGVRVSVRRMWFDFLNCWRCALALKLVDGGWTNIGMMSHDVFEGDVSMKFIKLDRTIRDVPVWSGIGPLLVEASVVQLMNDKLDQSRYSISVTDLRVDRGGTWVCELYLNWPRGGEALVCVYKFDGERFIVVFSTFSKDFEDFVTTSVGSQPKVYQTQEQARDAIIEFLPSIIKTFNGADVSVTAPIIMDQEELSESI